MGAGSNLGGDLPERGSERAAPLAQIAAVWTVVSCPGQRTLQVVDEMVSRGIRAWVPIGRFRRRVPRRRKSEFLVRPLIPGLVFLAEEDLDWVMMAKLAYVRPFLVNEAHPRIRVEQLAPLEMAEAMDLQKTAEPLAKGCRVEVLNGLFSSQAGKVVACRGRSYEVEFDGGTKVVLPGFLLRQV